MILQELKQRPLQNNRMRGWHALKRCNELDFKIVNANVQARQISGCATCFVKNPKHDSAAGLWVSFSTFAKFIRIATKSSLIDDDIITCQKSLTLPASAWYVARQPVFWNPSPSTSTVFQNLMTTFQNLLMLQYNPRIWNIRLCVCKS